MSRFREIESNLEIDYRDVPPWRSFEVSARGNSVSEMLVDATISEIDQDGGEIRSYGLEDASNEVSQRAESLIASLFQEAS